MLSIKKGYFIIFLLIAIDLASKHIAEEYLSFGQAVPLIPILDFNNSLLSFGLSVVGLLIVAYLYFLYKNEESTINRFSLILIISGALGNILDRLPDGVVTDFLFFHIGNTPYLFLILLMP